MFLFCWSFFSPCNGLQNKHIQVNARASVHICVCMNAFFFSLTGLQLRNPSIKRSWHVGLVRGLSPHRLVMLHLMGLMYVYIHMHCFPFYTAKLVITRAFDNCDSAAPLISCKIKDNWLDCSGPKMAKPAVKLRLHCGITLVI